MDSIERSTGINFGGHWELAVWVAIVGLYGEVQVLLRRRRKCGGSRSGALLHEVEVVLVVI